MFFLFRSSANCGAYFSCSSSLTPGQAACSILHALQTHRYFPPALLGLLDVPGATRMLAHPAVHQLCCDLSRDRQTIEKAVKLLLERSDEDSEDYLAWKNTATVVGLACLEAGKVDLAEKALEPAYPLDHLTLKKFLQACLDSGRVSEALTALRGSIHGPRRSGMTGVVSNTTDLECVRLVLKMLFQSGRAADMSDLVHDLRKAGVSLDESVFVEVIRAGFLMGDASTAVRTLAMMRVDGLVMTREVYEEMAKGFLIAGRPEQALQVLNEALVTGGLHAAATHAIYGDSVNASSPRFIDQSLPETAMSLLAHVILQQPPLSRSVISMIAGYAVADANLRSTIHAGVLRRLCVLSRSSEPGLVYFNVLRTTDTPPCEIEYHAFAGELGRLGHWDEAISLVGDANRVGIRDVKLQNVAIRAAIRQGALGKAVGLFEDMARLGLAPDVATFATLLEGAHKAGDGVLAERIFRELTFSGADRSFTEFWMRRMAGLLPAPPFAYPGPPEIPTFRRGPSAKRALAIRGGGSPLNESPSPGQMPISATEDTHLSVLSVLLADPPAAVRTVTEIARRKSPPLQRKTLHAVAKKICEAGDVDVVIQLISDLSAVGVVPGGAVMSRVLEALSRQGRVNEALSVIRTQKDLFDPVTEEHFSIILDALSMAEDRSRWCREVTLLWREMLATPGVVPTKKAYLAMLRSMVADPASTHSDIQKILENMARAKISVTPEDQISLFQQPLGPKANLVLDLLGKR